MTGYQSKKAAAQDKLELVDYEKLAALGWQAIECPFCGSFGAQAFPKPAQEPVAIECTCKAADMPFGRCCKAQLQTQEPKSVTYKEVADTMNALRKGNFSQQAAANEVGELKLYTAPPQRPWVGLTPEETTGFTQHEMSVVKYVSKVLMEKNT